MSHPPHHTFLSVIYETEESSSDAIPRTSIESRKRSASPRASSEDPGTEAGSPRDEALPSRGSTPGPLMLPPPVLDYPRPLPPLPVDKGSPIRPMVSTLVSSRNRVLG